MTSPIENGNGSGGYREGGGGSFPFRMRTVAIVAGVVIALVLALFLLGWIKQIVTDLFWFGNLGFRDVFETILVTRIWLFFSGFGCFAILVGTSIGLAYRYTRGPQIAVISNEILRILRPVTLAAVVLVIVIISAVFGAIAAGKWETILAFMNSTTFNRTDPQFGRDISFFMFTLPVHHMVQGWLLSAFITTTVVTLGIYFVRFSLRGAVFSLTTPVRIHMSILGALILLVFAYGYWLGIFDLVYSDRGAVFGATYADIHARIPGFYILLAVVLAGVGLLLTNAFFVRGTRLLVATGSIWIAAAVIVGIAFPSLVQRFQVIPSELEKEREYIYRNIDATRGGFGLTGLDQRAFEVDQDARITPELIQRNPETISNVRLWDHRPFKDTLNQIQFIRLYYDFLDVDVDRYTIDGEYKQMMVGARELSPEKLPSEAQRWVNRKLQFTHGFGVVAAPVTDFTSDGKPDFVLKDVPPKGEIQVDRPEIYYGENTRDYVIVNSNVEEFSYPTGDDVPVYANYKGNGGVQLKSFFHRFLYAWQFRDINVLISGEIPSESRIQYRRDISSRVHEVAPFLELDSDPYVVVANGRVLWIQDAYTVSGKYPYSTPIESKLGTFNYIRNSVKVVMDAYEGSLGFYIYHDDDPLIQTYSKAFPTLFHTREQMDIHHPGLSDHVRYPEDLFSIQAEQYLKYHMTDATVFYNKEDQWDIPEEAFFGQSNQTMLPYYLIMRLPGEDVEEFVLLMPFTPDSRPNMVSWLAARNDGEHYGELINFSFPRVQQVDGPAQVEARIDNDPIISQQFTLWGQVGSQVLRGNLLVIPIEDTILYVEPVFLQAENLAFPELKQVIVADSKSVVMRPSLAEALVALTGAASIGTDILQVSKPAELKLERKPEEHGTNEIQILVSEMSDVLQDVQKELDELKQSLEILNKITQGEAN